MAGNAVTLESLVRELQNRGFEGYDPDDLVKYINWGFQRLLRRMNWEWEESIDGVTVTPPANQFGTTFMTGGIEDLKDLIKIIDITDPANQFALRPVSADVFYHKWGSLLVFGGSTERGVPQEYYFAPGGFIYLLPPPLVERTYRVYHYQFVGNGTWDEGQFAFPTGYDEIILLGAEIICHRRARQLEFAADAEAQFESAIADMVIEQNMKHPDLQERVEAPWAKW